MVRSAFPPVRQVFIHLWHLPRTIAVQAISLYQLTLSPDHGLLRVFYPHGCCIYRETCSQYGKRIMLERGFVVGTVLAARRLLSCHPWKRLSDDKVMDIVKKIGN